MTDLISVVVPIYNVETYLSECIESIINQTYRNLEIILVNDGSTDNSGEICSKYEFKDERIKIINKENGGLSDARNVGISNSKGEFIYLIDSDDFICKKESIENMYNLMSEDVDMVVSYYYEKKDTEDIYILDKNCTGFEKMDSVEALNRMYNSKDFKYNFIVAHNKLYRKNLFEGIEYPKGKIHEDEFTTYKLYLKSRNIALLKETTYAYRIRENSIMTASYSSKKLSSLDAYMERLEIFKELGDKNLIKKTKDVLFYSFLYHRYMLYKNNLPEYEMVNGEYKSFLNENQEYRFNKLRFKFILKDFLYRIFGR